MNIIKKVFSSWGCIPNAKHIFNRTVLPCFHVLQRRLHPVQPPFYNLERMWRYPSLRETAAQ